MEERKDFDIQSFAHWFVFVKIYFKKQYVRILQSCPAKLESLKENQI